MQGGLISFLVRTARPAYSIKFIVEIPFLHDIERTV